jgi:hypothetical protein
LQLCSCLDDTAVTSSARACRYKRSIDDQVGNKTATASKIKVQLTVSPDGQAVRPLVEVRTAKVSVCSNVTYCSMIQALR